jgi:hypothetical protein
VHPHRRPMTDHDVQIRRALLDRVGQSLAEK